MIDVPPIIASVVKSLRLSSVEPVPDELESLSNAVPPWPPVPQAKSLESNRPRQEQEDLTQ